MAMMPAAARAVVLGARQQQLVVGAKAERTGQRLEEAGPAGAAVELHAAREQRQVAGDAFIGASPLLAVEGARERRLGSLLAQNAKLLGRESPAPLVVGQSQRVAAHRWRRVRSGSITGAQSTEGEPREQVAARHQGRLLSFLRNSGGASPRQCLIGRPASEFLTTPSVRPPLPMTSSGSALLRPAKFRRRPAACSSQASFPVKHGGPAWIGDRARLLGPTLMDRDRAESFQRRNQAELRTAQFRRLEPLLRDQPGANADSRAGSDGERFWIRAKSCRNSSSVSALKR